MHVTVIATLPILTKPVTWAGQGAVAVKQVSDQWLQYLADGLSWIVGSIQAVWTWSGDQIVRMTQAPWGTWPLWKQILLVIVAALVAYALFIAAKQLWGAALNVLSAVAGFVGTLIVTLPTILLAGAIALAGLWLINNIHDLSSLGSLVTPGGSGSSSGGGGAPGSALRHGPAEPTGGR